MAAKTISRSKRNSREATTASPTIPAARRVLGSTPGSLMAAVCIGSLDGRKTRSAALPLGRPLFGEGPRPLDEVLGMEQGGDRWIVALALEGGIQGGLVQAAHDRF